MSLGAWEPRSLEAFPGNFPTLSGPVRLESVFEFPVRLEQERGKGWERETERREARREGRERKGESADSEIKREAGEKRAGEEKVKGDVLYLDCLDCMPNRVIT